MTLDEAIASVDATLNSAYLRIDRARPHEDEASYLLVVLDTSRGRLHNGALANGPRLVDKHTGEITRLTVSEALARARRMKPARSRPADRDKI